MSNQLNTLTLVDAYGNTGIQQISFTPKEIIGAILVPTGWVADASYIASLKANLQADTLKAIGSRIFPIFSFGAIEDKSAESKYETFGYGAEKKASDGKYSWQFALMEGGIDLIKELRKFNGTDYNALFYTRDGVLIGTSTDTAGEITGVNIEYVDTLPWKPADGSKSVQTMIKFSLAMSATAQLNENIAFIKCDFDVEQEVKGCINVTLTQGTAPAVGVATVCAKTNNNAVNLYDLYSTELAASAAWVVTKVSDGSAISVSSVTKAVAVKGWALAFTYVGDVKISLASPSALAALSVGGTPDNGLESPVALTQTMPASS